MPQAADSRATRPNDSERVDEVQAVGDAEVAGEPAHALELGLSVGSARAADSHEHRVGVLELGEGGHRHVEALQRLDPADEEQHRVVAEAERTAGTGAVAGREERVVDTGWHDLDAGGIGAVEVAELFGLGGAVREDRVATADHRRLRLDTPLGFGVAGDRLHPSEGVEGRHEGDLETVLDVVARHPGEPVVRVDGVDRPGGAQVLHDAPGELVDDLGEVLLREVGRAGVDVDDPEAGFDLDDVGQLVAPPPDVHPGGHAGLGEGGDQLTHVDVHAAGVADARLGERRRVQRQDSEGSHDWTQRQRRSEDSPGSPDPDVAAAVAVDASARGARPLASWNER